MMQFSDLASDLHISNIIRLICAAQRRELCTRNRFKFYHIQHIADSFLLHCRCLRIKLRLCKHLPLGWLSQTMFCFSHSSPESCHFVSWAVGLSFHPPEYLVLFRLPIENNQQNLTETDDLNNSSRGTEKQRTDRQLFQCNYYRLRLRKSECLGCAWLVVIWIGSQQGDKFPTPAYTNTWTV